MDISGYTSGITANIINQTLPFTISPTTIGNAYNDLANLTKSAVEQKLDITGSTIFLTGITSNQITNALGYTPSTGVTLTVTSDGTTSTNLFDKSAVIPNQYVSTATFGIVKDSSATGWTTSNYIPVSGGTQITINGLVSLLSKAVQYSDVNKVVLSGTSGIILSGAPQTITVPSNCAYIILNVQRNTDTVTDFSTVMINTGSTALSYQPYVSGKIVTQINNNAISAKTLVSGATLNGKVIATTDYVVAALPSISSTTINSRNLFNAVLGTDGFYLENTGFPGSSATYGYSDFIPVISGLIYTGFDGLNGMRKTCFYDANKNVLSGSGSTNNITSFTVPSGVAYVKVTYYVSGKGTFQFEQSATATPFVPYSVTSYLNGINNLPLPAPGLVQKLITLKNREVDVWFGDSYSMGEYNLKGKSYLDNLSMFTDRNIENYSRSGDRLDNILNRIQTDNKTYHNTLGINEYPSGGYGFILSWTNEFASGGTMYNASGVTAYIANMKALADAVKALGFKPVICTEYYAATGAGTGALIESALSDLCAENGYLFVDIANKAQLTRGATDNPKYWFGSHPGVRTNTIFWYPFVKYVQSLPRPKTGIKIFRKRTSYSGTTVASLNYSSLIERSTAFKELFIGQSAASGTSENYYDDLTALNTAGTYTSQKLCDYIKLQNKENTAFADYGLFEVVVNATANNVTSLSLNVSGTTGLTGYVKDWVNNTWVALASTTLNGYQVFSITNNQTQIKYDKASFLIYQASGFTINDVNVSWSGIEGKDMLQKSLPVELSTSQLLSATTINSGFTGWTATGTIAPFLPSDTNVPTGAVQVATIDSNNYLSQNITFPAETERTRKVQIKLTGRKNPAQFASSGGTYPTGAAITDDTYDLGIIGVDLQLNTSNIITFDRVVGLHWSEALIEFVLPPNVNTLTMSVKGRNQSIEFAKASVKIEG